MINGAAESAAIIRALDGVPLFRDLAPELLAMVAAEATTRRRFLDPRTLIDPVGMVRVAMQAMDVGARERTTANLALTDICVQPALGAYATTDVQKLPAILEAGEAAAEAALPGIHAALHLGAPTG
jgi:hypothetical protein